MGTISGEQLLAIEALRADVARVTAERDEAFAARDAALVNLGKVAKDQSGTLHHIDRLEAEVERLRGVLADVALANFQRATARLEAINVAVAAFQDVMDTAHLSRPMRERALAAIKALRSVWERVNDDSPTTKPAEMKESDRG